PPSPPSTYPLSLHDALPISYTATLTVADSHGRRATATQTIVVKSMAGAWFYGGYNRAVGRFELRRLTITDQNGSSVRGSFAASGDRKSTRLNSSHDQISYAV